MKVEDEDDRAKKFFTKASVIREEGGDIITENKGLLRIIYWRSRRRRHCQNKICESAMKWMLQLLFFSDWRKSQKEQKFFHKLKLPNGKEITSQREIIVSAISFYEKLYQSEFCDEAAVEELLLDLPQLSKEEKMELEEFLTFSELSSAVQGPEQWQIFGCGWSLC